MTAVSLPDLPLGAEATPRPMEFGGPQTPMWGGATQDLQRPGDRWSLEILLPPEEEEIARTFYGARMRAKADQSTVVLNWPQPDFAIPIGTPLVNGATQTGTSLIIDGATRNAFLPAMRFLSFVAPTQDGASTRNYLHMVTTDLILDGTGAGTLHLWPMIRVSPADDTAIELVNPKIEGFIHTPADFSLEYRRFFNFSSFVLAENE